MLFTQYIGSDEIKVKSQECHLRAYINSPHYRFHYHILYKWDALILFNIKFPICSLSIPPLCILSFPFPNNYSSAPCILFVEHTRGNR